MPTDLLFLTNIPSSYRLHFYNHLYREASRREIDCQVWFMAANEPGRHWPYDPDLCQFPHRLLPGIHLPVSQGAYHLNPQAWIKVLRSPPRLLILGGSWSQPTNLGFALLDPLIAKRSTIIYHAEANYHFSRHLDTPLARLRRLVLSTAAAFAVPGETARNTIREHWSVPDRPFLQMTNCVDKRVYHHRVMEARKRRSELRESLELAPSDFVAFFPARLEEHTKGNLNFLQALEPLHEPRLKVLLAGDGPDRSELETWLRTSGLSGVHLLGHQPTERMIELLALSDLLVLPSFREAYGFVVVEGLWAGLPVMVSKYCGCWPETVEEGENGWLIDPDHPVEIRKAIRQALQMSPLQLEAYRQRSLAIARERFDTPRVVNRFLDQLLSFDRSRPESPAIAG